MTTKYRFALYDDEQKMDEAIFENNDTDEAWAFFMSNGWDIKLNRGDMERAYVLLEETINTP